MDKDAFFIGAATVALVAAFLTIVDRILSLRERLRTANEDKSAPKSPEEFPTWDSSRFKRLSARYPWTKKSPLSYLFYREILIIGGAGILLNYLGLALSLQLESILFLDMTGTALVAFLLGPWWGAVVALLSSSVVNWLLYPEPGADVLIFPWSLVNMTGALFWGAIARSPSFQRYLAVGHTSVIAHLWSLVRLGVLGAVIMSIPGTFVLAAIPTQTEVALHSGVVRSLEGVVPGWQALLHGHIEPLLGAAWANTVGWAVVHWLQNCVRYIPDKTLSVAIALVVLKYGFPLFERELIHGGPTRQRPKDGSTEPLILGLLYLPCFVALLSAEVFSGARYWPLWSAPWLIIIGGFFVLQVWGQSKDEVQEARLSRAVRYFEALKPIEREPSYQFCRRLGLATLMASALVALCLPLLLPDYGSVAFNFFCVVYGFLLAMHLLHVAISQNLSIARMGGFRTVESADPETHSQRTGHKRSAQR